MPHHDDLARHCGPIPVRPVACVGVVCRRGDAVLLIRRGRAPRLGEWSIPGGRVETGETVRDAALRELREETGVTARIDGLIDVVDAVWPQPGPADLVTRHYVLIDFAATWIAGEPVAGDDADAAEFVSAQEALARVAWGQTRRIIQAAQGVPELRD